MFNKTIRSVLSLALVFVLLLGMSGNAIAMAVSNPVAGKIDQIDTEVNTTITELETLIADLEKEVATQEQNLADAQDKLETGKEDLAEAQKTLDEKKELLDDARAELDSLQGKLDEADEMLGKLEEKAAEYQAQLDDAQKQLDNAQTQLDDAYDKLTSARTQLADAQDLLAEKQAEKDAKQAELNEVKVDLEEAAKKFDEAMADFLELEQEVNAMPDGPAKDAAQEELDKLGAEVTKANEDMKSARKAVDDAQAKLDDAQVKLDDAQDQLDDAWKQLADAQIQLDDAQELKNQYQADKDAYQAKLDDALVQLADAQEQVDWAKGEYQKLYDTIDEIEGTIDNYQAKADEADAAVVKAEEALPKAEVALVEAKEALADAKALVENIKTTYETLHNAVTNPEVSVDFVRETVATLNEQVNALWTSMLVLQTSLHELIAAYEELEGFAIDPIVIDDYYFEGLVIEPFEVGEYHYEEVGFHFNGYKFDGYTVDPVTVEGYTFEGFTAPEMPAQLTQISDTLDQVIAKVVSLNASLNYYVAAAKNAVAKALEIAGAVAAEIEQVLGISFDALRVTLNRDLHIRAYNWLYNNPDVVCGLVKKFGVFGLDLLVKFGPYALDLLQNNSELAIFGMKVTVGGTYLTVTLGAAVLGYVGDRMDFLADYKDDVMKAAGKLYAKYGDEAKALIEVYVDYLGLRERYENATHADYDIFHDSLYVAIGDSTAAVSGSYVEKLAEMMGIPHMTENLGQFDMTVADAIGMVGQNAELIGKADLITLGFSNIPASFEVMNALVADYDNDFTTQVGNIVTKSVDKVIYEVKEHMAAIGFSQDKIALVDRAGEMVDNGLTALNNRLIAEGLDEATINMVMQATEAYAVAYLSRAVWYPCLVNAVQDVNPDAQIVIVGTYNDLDGVVLEVSGRNVNIGEYVKYLVAAANLENLVQAFFEDGVIYVNAHNVETVFEENAYEGLNNLGYLQAMFNDEMLPSEAGATYIAEQIFDALDIEYKILGDVNGDHKVNCRDARLLLLYAAELVTEDEIDLTWADVNGDGRVNTRDARLVLLYCVELIEHFPACNLS